MYMKCVDRYMCCVYCAPTYVCCSSLVAAIGFVFNFPCMCICDERAHAAKAENFISTIVKSYVYITKCSQHTKKTCTLYNVNERLFLLFSLLQFTFLSSSHITTEYRNRYKCMFSYDMCSLNQLNFIVFVLRVATVADCMCDVCLCMFVTV